MRVFGNIFLNNIVPAFLVMAAGVILDRVLKIDKKSLSRTAIYVLAPCMVFSSVVSSSVEMGVFISMIVFCIVIILVMCGLALLVGRILGWSPRSTYALVLSVGFFNAGNFGLSILLFSYGEEAFALGVIFFTALAFASQTLSAFFAARGNCGSGKEALGRVLKLPTPYVFILAIVLRSLKVQVPGPLLDPVALVGSAAVPVMLLMLGLQLSQTKMGGQYGKLAVGVVLRLIVGALAAVGLASVMGLEGLARNVAVVEASTPTAATSGLMAIEFDADADYVSGVIFLSTLLSSVTLTVIISLLGS
ncbi:MAG: hypothetical protein A2Y73_03015 [Chloroflexi bacterium RBG_13_56_8]|nr:MAG: hypothetical protein A2Y73_03015 [Chloroflexi bacterium RBG_13_56_8]